MSTSPGTTAPTVFESGQTLLPNQDEPTEDPTGTKTTRNSFVQRFNSKWADIRGLLRDTIEHNDALRLRDTDHGPTFSPPPGGWSGTVVEDFGTESDATRLARFTAWFRRVLERHVLEPTALERVEDGAHYSAQFIRKSYARGLALSGPLLTQAGYEVETSASDLIGEPRHQENVGTLQVQTYTDVERATNETHAQTTRELATGLAALSVGALTVRELTNTLTERVDAVGQTRTALIAHTRVVDAVNTAAIERYTAAGVSEVGVTVEWVTAGDQRVCPECASLASSTHSLAAVRAGTAPRPPRHPRCRCLLTAV